MVVCVSEGDGLPLATQALKAHAFWRGRGFQADLVLLADRPASYREELYEALGTWPGPGDSRDVIDKPGGVFVRKGKPGARTARCCWRPPGSCSTATAARWPTRPTSLAGDATCRRPSCRPARRAGRRRTATDRRRAAVRQRHRRVHPDGREYVVTDTPPAPWANVLANPGVGCLATDAGLGSTWAGNSQANRLTPWSNDPVSDPPAEAVYVRDEETGQFWTPTPCRPAGGAAGVWHGPGYTSYAADAIGSSPN